MYPRLSTIVHLPCRWRTFALVHLPSQVLVDLTPRSERDALSPAGYHPSPAGYHPSSNELGLARLSGGHESESDTGHHGGRRPTEGGGWCPSSVTDYRRPGSATASSGRMASADAHAAQLLTLVRHRDEPPATSREQMLAPQMRTDRGGIQRDSGHYSEA